MIKKSTIYDWLAHIMVIWAVSMLLLCFFCMIFGERAYGYSAIFALGSRGIPVAAALQFLLLAAIITLLRWIFFTDVIVKRLGILGRSIAMFTCAIASVALFAMFFQWFPVDDALPWMMFFISFAVSTAISVVVSVKKEKADRRMQEALERMKGENKNESGSSDKKFKS